MSLKTIHLAFALAMVVLIEIFAAWALLQYPRTGEQLSLWAGLLALIVGVGLFVHAIRFARRMGAASAPWAPRHPERR